MLCQTRLAKLISIWSTYHQNYKTSATSKDYVRFPGLGSLKWGPSIRQRSHSGITTEPLQWIKTISTSCSILKSNLSTKIKINRAASIFTKVSSKPLFKWNNLGRLNLDTQTPSNIVQPTLNTSQCKGMRAWVGHFCFELHVRGNYVG